jgi:transposase-like protein
MSRKSHVSAELKAQILKEVQEVGAVVTVARKHNVDAKTIHNWMRAVKGRPKLDQARELRELQKKLKNVELENVVLKELLKKTYPHWQSAERL